jgi:hypothetical protein
MLIIRSLPNINFNKVQKNDKDKDVLAGSFPALALTLLELPIMQPWRYALGWYLAAKQRICRPTNPFTSTRGAVTTPRPAATCPLLPTDPQSPDPAHTGRRRDRGISPVDETISVSYIEPFYCSQNLRCWKTKQNNPRLPAILYNSPSPRQAT